MPVDQNAFPNFAEAVLAPALLEVSVEQAFNMNIMIKLFTTITNDFVRLLVLEVVLDIALVVLGLSLQLIVYHLHLFVHQLHGLNLIKVHKDYLV